MKSCVFQEDAICSGGDSRLTEENLVVVRRLVRRSHPVGFLAGCYDEALTITDASSFFLQNLGYESFADLAEHTGFSLKRLVYGENRSFLEPDRFPQIQGAGDGQLLTRDGVPLYTRLYKQDTVDGKGSPIWVMTAQIDWTRQNLYLVNNVIQSGLWYIDCDEQGQETDIVYSHEFRRMMGYHDILDFPNRLTSWSGLIHPEDRDRTVKMLKDAMADSTGTIRYDTEYRMRLADGTYQWFRDSGEASRRMNGTVRRMVGIFVNIDQKKRAEIQAKKSEAFHRAYTESNLCEYYVDLQTGRVESLKLEHSMLAELEPGQSWDALAQAYREQFVSPKDRERVAQFFDRAHMSAVLRDGSTENNLECRIFLQGKERWVRNMVMPGETDASARYALVILRDITEARKGELRARELVQQNRAMNLLIEGMVKLVDRFALCDLEADSYIFCGMQSGSVYPSKGAYHVLTELIGQRFQSVSQEKTLQQILSAAELRRVLQKPEDLYKIEYCAQDGGQTKSLAMIPLDWKEPGRVRRVLLIAQDTTQEKQAETAAREALKVAYDAANRANSAKTEFLSNMSHDIRTPMNAIVGMTAIAGANLDNQERVRDCLGKITQSSRHLLALINEVLDMSRIESGKVFLSEEDFNLAELVENLIGMTKAGIAAHQHDFEVHLQSIEHEDVCGDSLRIQQVITNILSNAIKYTPDGGRIVFSIAERPTQSRGLGCYEFTVEDNGIGMTPEFQQVLFEPFTRADDKRTTRIQGTGLGMAIAQNIVTMMNGRIDVESTLGRGSRFTVTIFLKLQDTGNEELKELVDLPVLVVDDDPVCCESTVGILKEIGLDGESVTTGKEAVERTVARHEKQEDYFAVIVDWKMPGMDGIETARQIRQKVGDEVPIVVLTAYDYSSIEEEAREAGVNEFITKPLFRSRLTTALRNIAAGRSAHPEEDSLSDLRNCSYAGHRILLVEDNDLNREIACEIIGMTGAAVETAENGRAAVEKFMKAPQGYYDLIFMDIQMPVMNGYEAAAAIRSMKEHGGLAVPIVAMTANAFAEDVLLAKNAGMNEHVAKPLDLGRLHEVLQRWLK